MTNGSNGGGGSVKSSIPGGKRSRHKPRVRIHCSSRSPLACTAATSAPLKHAHSLRSTITSTPLRTLMREGEERESANPIPNPEFIVLLWTIINRARRHQHRYLRRRHGLGQFQFCSHSTQGSLQWAMDRTGSSRRIARQRNPRQPHQVEPQLAARSIGLLRQCFWGRVRLLSTTTSTTSLGP